MYQLPRPAEGPLGIVLWFAVMLVIGTAIPVPGTAQGVSITRVHSIVSGPSPADHFRHPRGLVVDPEHGVIAVGDTGNHRLAFFDSRGRYRGSISWVREQKQPRSVAIDRRRRIFVLDGEGREIEVLSATGTRIGRLSLSQCLEDDEVTAAAISIGSSGQIYALLTGEKSGLAIIASNGKSARVIEFAQIQSGDFKSPSAFAVHPDEKRVVLLDQQAEFQVKVVSMDGQLLHELGPHGEGPGTFAMACAATWGPHGALWVVDTIRHTINVYDADASYVGRIGGFGHGPGQFNYPSICAFLSDEVLVVLERSGKRFQVLGLERQFLEGSRAGLDTSGSEKRGQFVQPERMVTTPDEASDVLGVCSGSLARHCLSGTGG